MARTNKNRAPALAYLRTSSAANVGTDKDSEKRQRHAVQGFAKRTGYSIVDKFYDASVSGADGRSAPAWNAAALRGLDSELPSSFPDATKQLRWMPIPLGCPHFSWVLGAS